MNKLLQSVLLQSVVFFGLTIIATPLTYAEDTTTPMERQAESERSEHSLIAVVNGVGIRKQDLETKLEEGLPRQFHDSTRRKLNKMEITKRRILDQLIWQELLYQEAEKRKVAVDKDLIKEEMDKLIGKYSEDELKTILERNNITVDEIRETIERKQLIKNMEDKMQEEFEKEAEEIVNEAYVADYYRENPDKFKMPEKYRLREILIRVDPGVGKKGWQEAQERTEEIRKRIEAGESFEALAREVSNDKYAESGGDMGFVHKGSLIPEVGDHIVHMEIGDLAGPIWTLYGFHLFKLEEKTPAELLDLSLVKENIKKNRTQDETKRLYKEWRDKIRNEADVKIFR